MPFRPVPILALALIATIPFLFGCKRRTSHAKAGGTVAQDMSQVQTNLPPLTETELAEKSAEFRAFYKSLEGVGPRREIEIDMAALVAFSGAERDEVENVLISRIENTGGPVIEALVEMKSQKGAMALKRNVEKAGGTSAVEAALALWKIEKWPHAEDILIDVLEGRRKYFTGDSDPGLSDFDAMGRQDAARALGEIPSVRSKKALTRALKDPDDMVRYNAQGALSALGRGSRP